MTLDLKLRRKSEGGHLNKELRRKIRITPGGRRLQARGCIARVRRCAGMREGCGLLGGVRCALCTGKLAS